MDDSNLLERFRQQKYQRAKHAPKPGLYTVLADDGEWTMLADSWHYTLWHRNSTRIAIEELATMYDVFTCSVGDSDESFDFLYYENEILIRKFVVEDPNYNGGSVTENYGSPLPRESEILASNSDQLKMVLKIARSLGIKTDYTEDELRIYVSP
ncbi:MAG: hypothetical protein ACKVH8_15845 [Pirellulales bacterium]